MGVPARSTSLTRTSELMLAVVLMALVVTAAHGARTGPWDGAPGQGGGAGAGGAAMRRSALDVVEASKAGPSCCTHDPSKRGSSCCPRPQTLTP
ncbi:unnamed protein product [Urochloa decumbens]|uniref:Uncharacterized protein n=1 Tax=Urochloa decumbens TaxID=240449 RepID=A0ABC8YKS8_9POAL